MSRVDMRYSRDIVHHKYMVHGLSAAADYIKSKTTKSLEASTFEVYKCLGMVLPKK